MNMKTINRLIPAFKMSDMLTEVISQKSGPQMAYNMFSDVWKNIQKDMKPDNEIS